MVRQAFVLWLSSTPEGSQSFPFSCQQLLLGMCSGALRPAAIIGIVCWLPLRSSCYWAWCSLPSSCYWDCVLASFAKQLLLSMYAGNTRAELPTRVKGETLGQKLPPVGRVPTAGG